MAVEITLTACTLAGLVASAVVWRLSTAYWRVVPVPKFAKGPVTSSFDHGLF